MPTDWKAINKASREAGNTPVEFPKKNDPLPAVAGAPTIPAKQITTPTVAPVPSQFARLSLPPRDGVPSEFLEKFAEFNDALLANSPNMESYMEKIRRDISEMPDLVWKLTPEEIGLIVSGSAKIQRIEIVSATTSKSKNKKADLDSLVTELEFLNNGGAGKKSGGPKNLEDALAEFGGVKF